MSFLFPHVDNIPCAIKRWDLNCPKWGFRVYLNSEELWGKHTPSVKIGHMFPVLHVPNIWLKSTRDCSVERCSGDYSVCCAVSKPDARLPALCFKHDFATYQGNPISVTRMIELEFLRSYACLSSEAFWLMVFGILVSLWGSQEDASVANSGAWVLGFPWLSKVYVLLGRLLNNLPRVCIIRVGLFAVTEGQWKVGSKLVRGKWVCETREHCFPLKPTSILPTN